jgi:putative exosortase-associated protein (TIGR04073 family)
VQGSKTRIRGVLAAGLVAAILLPGLATAAQQSAARKAGRGLAAMTCGFLEVPGNIVAETRSRGPVWGFTLGFVTGLGKIVVRELVGVYEFVTAPFEIPDGFQPIIQPEFPWSYFEKPAPRSN